MANGAKSKKLSDREVSAILRRAADIQSKSSDEQPGESDVTLERLTQAAAEIGIDPDAIQQAAKELLDSEAKRGKKSSPFGVSWDFDETVIARGEVTPQNWPMILEELRDSTGRVGYPSANGFGFEWLSRQPDPLHVSFTPIGDSVRVRVKAKLGGWAAAFHLAPPAAVVGIVLAMQSPLREGLHASAVLITELVCLPALAATVGHFAFKRFSGNRRSATRMLLKCATAGVSSGRAVETEQTVIPAAGTVQPSSAANVQNASYPTNTESEEEQVVRQGL